MNTRRIDSYFSEFEIKFLIDLLEKEKKKIRKKFKDEIKNEWYDLNENGIDSRIGEREPEFERLSDLVTKILQ